MGLVATLYGLATLTVAGLSAAEYAIFRRFPATLIAAVVLLIDWSLTVSMEHLGWKIQAVSFAALDALSGAVVCRLVSVTRKPWPLFLAMIFVFECIDHVAFVGVGDNPWSRFVYDIILDAAFTSQLVLVGYISGNLISSWICNTLFAVPRKQAFRGAGRGRK